jgi:glucose/arabinose dehydrogenase
MRRGALAAAGALLLAGCSSAGPDEPEPSRVGQLIQLTQVASATAPTAGVPGPDGTVWIAERRGTVRPLGERGLGEPVLDISDETTTDGERGLLGIAFDDSFTHFYASYTDLDGDTAVDEFAVVDGELRPDTRRTVLTQDQPYANHNGGDLAFGPDGMLYIGLGDGGSGGDPHGNGQDLGTLLGTLLRIDPTGAAPYAIPPDNPFVDDPAARGEIWAYGLRNPWRFSFDVETGDLWIGDVGQDAWEEIDRLAGGEGGANLGWSAMEGSRPFNGDEPSGHVAPVFEYETGDRCSVTGGYVYRGSAIPELEGSYVFSDYCDGTLRALELSGGRAEESSLGVDGGAVVGFVQGPDLELYVLDLDGAVRRLDPAADGT